MQLSRKAFHSIVDGIQFRFVAPHDHVPTKPYEEFELLGKRYPTHVLNTSFGANDDAFRAALSPLFGIQSMSTIANAYLIYQITHFLGGNECYLNIGVWKGFTFFAGVLNKAAISIGVDNFSEFGGPIDDFNTEYAILKHEKSSFFNMDYATYLQTVHKHKIGLYFYDGPHSYDHQLRAIEVAEPFFSEGAIIIIDDTNHKSARDATLDFLKRRHRMYEIIFDQFTAANAHPTYHNGLMIVQRVS